MSVPYVQLSPEAEALVAAAVDRHGSVSAVAGMLGYSRASLSLARSGRYRAHNLTRLEAAIAATFGGGVRCPHLARTIAAAECRRYRERPIPTADPAALRLWQACRFCLENPDRQPLTGGRITQPPHQAKDHDHA